MGAAVTREFFVLDGVPIEAFMVRETDVSRIRPLSKCVPKLRGPSFLLRGSCRLWCQEGGRPSRGATLVKALASLEVALR